MVFHVELRRFPHNTHAFNLSEEQLRRSILGPWRRGETVDVGGQKWVPELSHLVVLEGQELDPPQLSLGRGWAAAQRSGRDVTKVLLAEPPGSAVPAATVPAGPPLEDLKSELLVLSAAGLISVHQVWRLASSWYPAWRVSDRLTAAERALRELLLEGRVRLCRGTRASASAHVVPGSDLEPILLAMETWTGDEGLSVFVSAAPQASTGAST